MKELKGRLKWKEGIRGEHIEGEHSDLNEYFEHFVVVVPPPIAIDEVQP